MQGIKRSGDDWSSILYKIIFSVTKVLIVYVLFTTLLRSRQLTLSNCHLLAAWSAVPNAMR